MSDRHDISMKMQIIHHALRLFKQYSYERVTVQDICDACELTRSAFYYHFRSKDEILDYCYLGADTLDIEAILENEAGLTSLEQFYLIFEFYLNQTISVGHQLFGQMLIRNIERHSLSFHPKHIVQRSCYIDLLEQAQQEGLIQNMSDPEDLVDAIVYISNGIALIWCDAEGDLDMMAQHRLIINTLLMPASVPLVDTVAMATEVVVTNSVLLPEETPSAD